MFEPRKSMPRSAAVSFTAALIGSLLAGCSSGHNPTVATLSGAIVKGPVDGATVCAYELVPTGKGSQLGCTRTRADGSYTLDLAFSGPVIVEATGGTYVDEASGAPGVALGAPLTTAGLLAAEGSFLAATPLTTMALSQAVNGGNLSLTTFDSAADPIKTAFGLDAAVDLARTAPDVSAGNANAYGRALIGISKMMQGGATLPGILSATDLQSIANSYQICTAEPVPVALDLQVDLKADVPADGPPTQIEVVAPDARWRANLPASGAVDLTSCQVTSNSESSVLMTCSPATGLAGLSIFAGGSAANQAFVAQPNSYSLQLAGDKVALTGGALRLNAAVPLTIDGGSGEIRINTGGAVQTLEISAGSLTLNGGVPAGPSCTLSSGGTAQVAGSSSLHSGGSVLGTGSLPSGFTMTVSGGDSIARVESLPPAGNLTLNSGGSLLGTDSLSSGGTLSLGNGGVLTIQ
jgi:hypothetical protein